MFAHREDGCSTIFDSKMMPMKVADSESGPSLPRVWVLIALFTILLGFAGAFFFLSRGASVAMVVLIASVVLAAAELQTYFQFFCLPKPSFMGMTSRGSFWIALSASFFAAFLLEAGTLIGAPNSTPLELGDWRAKRFFVFFMVSYLLILFALEYVPADISDRFKLYCHNRLRRTLFAFLVAYGSSFILALAVGFLFHRYCALSFWPQLLFWFFLFAAVATGAVHFGFKIISLEFSVMLILLLAGTSIISAIPISNLFSWDDEIHYSNALHLSYFSDAELTSSDLMLMHLFDVQGGHTVDASMGRFPVDGSLTWREDEIDLLTAELDAGYGRGVVATVEGIASSTLSYSMLGYVPSAVGLWLGRLFHFPLSLTFMLGRFANLLCYATVCFFAIRIIPCKKLLMGVLALMPTSVFMAANFAYDPWVISFGFLSVSLIVRSVDSSNPPTSHVVFAILLSFFVGLAPKAVYFPLIGLMFLIPTKGLTPRARRAFYSAVVVLGLVVVASFLAPLVVSNGGGAGDMRGGEGVNSSAQVRYVLGNPVAYASTMLKFLSTSYLTPASFGAATVQWAYLSDLSVAFPWLANVVLIFVFCVALLDSDACSRKIFSVAGAVWALFLVAISLVGICTALYFSFTPVALDWINGVQSRYLLPLVLPLLVFVLNMPYVRRWGRRFVPVAVMVVSVSLLGFTSWMLLFSRLVV